MLTDEQLEDLAGLHIVARQFAADVAIIGAAALRCFVDLGRFTRDIDVVVALDLDAFAAFSAELKTRGWMPERAREHRWRGPSGSVIDLLPAGPNLRAVRRIVWPESRFAMSVAGFEHVFTRAVLFPFTPDVRFRVAPPPVIALLKIIAYTEDPQRREKDLIDLKSLLRRYEASSDRIFGDNVFAADLEDIEYANAFLLGWDIGLIATGEDAGIVHAFLSKHRISAAERADFDRDDPYERDTLRFQMQIDAFEKGFTLNRRS